MKGGFSKLWVFLYLCQNLRAFDHKEIRRIRISDVIPTKVSVVEPFRGFLRYPAFTKIGKIKNTKNADNKKEMTKYRQFTNIYLTSFFVDTIPFPPLWRIFIAFA